MSHRKNGCRTSSKPIRNSLAYIALEARVLLANASPPAASMYDDVFAPGAVSVEHVLKRAVSHSFVPNQIIVAIEVPRPKDEVRSFLQSVNWPAMTGLPQTSVIREMMSVQRTPNQSVSLVHLDLGPVSDPLAVVNRLGANTQVLWSSPNFVHNGSDPRDFIPDDPSYGSQYHHPLMKNPLAWDVTLGNPSIEIGVTDDGVAIPHVDLNPNIWVNSGEIASNGIDDDGNGYIDDTNGWDFSSANNDPNPNGNNEHGTHVAGIAAGRTNNTLGIAGTAGLSTIVPLQFYAGTSSWTAAIINETYTYAANNGVQIVTTSYNVDGWVGDPVFLAGLQYMYNAGVLHFNSAGNNSQLNPARQVFEESLFVSSTDASDLKSSFSNWGTGIDIAAPGSSIYSTILNNGYGTKSGTSMSTPNAAGAAALVWGANPSWNRDQVAAQLLYFTDNIDSLNPLYAGLLGGRANPHRALTNTLPAPRVKSISGLPGAGSTAASWNSSSFTVAFDQVMAPATVNSLSNYELRYAGLDDVFGSTDDTVYTLSSANNKIYKVGTNSMTFNFAGGQLQLGNYRLTMFSGGLRNPFNTSLDGNANGTGGDNYVHTFSIQPPTLKLQTLGSQIHEQAWSSAIGAAGETFDYYLNLDTLQKLTVISQPTGSLVPTVQVRNPAGVLVGSGSMVGTSSVVSNLPISTAGRYRITFGGSGSSTGGYNVRLLLNAVVELETLNGPSNNTDATAQNIDLTAVQAGTRGADRLGIVGSTSPSAIVALGENFETGSLNASWVTSSSSAAGRIRVIGTPSTAAGSFALIMDVSTDNTYSRNQATWTVNLAGLTNPTLRFSEVSFADEINSMPASFVGTSDTDGVAMSADGINWFRIWTPPSGQTSNVWTQRTVDLAAAATAAGIALGSNFQIRFQQYDNYPVSTDGRGFDEIAITVPSSPVDWYEFSLADGEYATIAGSRLGTTGTHQIELYNSSGALLATGSSAVNASNMISRYRDNTTNGTRDLYRVKVSGDAAEYSLVVTRNSDFDREGNDALATAQDFYKSVGVFGFATTVPDIYRFNASPGDEINFSASLPAGGSNLFENGLISGTSNQFEMLLIDPAGAKVAIGTSAVTHLVSEGGTWYLSVRAKSGAGGEYFVQRDISSPRLFNWFANRWSPTIRTGISRSPNASLQFWAMPIRASDDSSRIGQSRILGDQPALKKSSIKLADQARAGLSNEGNTFESKSESREQMRLKVVDRFFDSFAEAPCWTVPLSTATWSKAPALREKC